MKTVLAALIASVLAGCSGDAAESADCQPADTALVESITEGLTIDGGGTLQNGQAVEVAEDRRNDRGWPVYIVAAEITGEGMNGAIGTWATDAEGGPIFALNSMAQEFSEWGAAANPGSPAAEMRDQVAAYEEASQAEECASA